MHRIPALLVLACVISAADPVPITLSTIRHQPLRDRIATLAPADRAAALAMLTARPGLLREAEHLGVTSGGGICLLNCAAHPAGAPVRAPQIAGGPARAPIPIASVPAYASLPGAPNTLYLDFNGEVITGTDWNVAYSVVSWDTMPFDTDGASTTFSDDEQDAIFLIWQRVAEDYRPVNVNVTTILPASFGPNTGRALITRNTDRVGTACPSSGAGGVAYVGVFGTPGFLSRQPAWVYYNNLGSGQEDYVAEATSHEIGHNMGLTHDGTSVLGYFPGHGPPTFNWGPLMGTGYDCIMSQWSIGEYTDANNNQDDLAIINAALGTPLSDDHGDIIAGATALTLTGSAPQTITAFDAIVSSATDTDMFSFTCVSGTVSITITPRTVTSLGFLTPQTPGANLDARADILDSSGNVILTSDVQDNIVASLTGVLPSSGNYILSVRGAGNRNPLTDGYSSYGSVGQYRVTGTVPAAISNSLGFNAISVVETEGNSGLRTINLYVSRASGSVGAATVRYDTSDQAATAASGDYTAVVNGLLAWAPGDPLTKTVSITVNGDTAEELDESFLVTLSAPTGAILDANPIAMIALRNDDGASAALAASTAASIQGSGTGDSGSCGAGGIAGLLLGVGGLGLLRRRRR